MAEVKVKNKGSQIFIGPKLCPTGRITPVDEKDLEVFCGTPGGSALLNKSLFIYDDDFKKQKEASANAMRQQAEAKVRQELTPVLEKEIKAKLEKIYGKKIEDLEKTISSLEKKLDAVDDLVSDDDDSKEFVFDPENHTIEHRGAGKYFVMSLEDKKLYGPLTEDEKANFEAMQKAD